ncbi:MAG: hypothetical protein HY460_01780 [Parcubacteria group bacterium]|nr:hypothetical protein [Parcubacteria group bacterium]
MDVVRKQENQNMPAPREPFSVGVLGALAVAFAVIMGLVGVGFWGYAAVLQKKADTATSELAAIENELRSGDLEKALEKREKISRVQQIVREHHIMSPNFTVIESLMLPQVQASSITIDADEQTYAINAIATSAIAVSQQVAAFLNDPRITSVQFDGIQRGEENRFAFEMEIVAGRELFILPAALSE